VARLASADFPTREGATARLLGHEEAEPALRHALGAADAEARRRAARVLETFRRRRAADALSELPELARRGRGAELAERAVCWRERDPGGLGWEAAAALAHRLLGAARLLRKNPFAPEPDPYVPWEDYRKFRALYPRPEYREASLALRRALYCLAAAERIDARDLTASSVLLASGPVTVQSLGACVLLANGPVDVGPGGCGTCVLVCDGDVRLRGQVGNCLVVARGKCLGGGRPA
jgi:hypothetical protein